MPNDDHVAMLGLGAAVWTASREELDETPDLSRAGIRGLDLSGFDLSRVDLLGADLRGTNSAMRICQVPVSRARTSSKLYLMAPILPGPF
jgi:uncharacterized protein YjbI with pentapeptide repeats